VIVTGTGAPAHAVVRVADKRVRVRRGSFVDAINLNRPTTRIRIVARARGYRPARVETTVHYSAGTARVMLLARRAATSVKALASATTSNGTAVAPLLSSRSGRAEFMSGCTQGGGQEQTCACFYQHLAGSGAFDTRAGQTASLDQIIQAGTSGDVTAMPVRSARRWWTVRRRLSTSRRAQALPRVNPAARAGAR
jgi:hypothetical protein